MNHRNHALMLSNELIAKWKSGNHEIHNDVEYLCSYMNKILYRMQINDIVKLMSIRRILYFRRIF